MASKILVAVTWHPDVVSFCRGVASLSPHKREMSMAIRWKVGAFRVWAAVALIWIAGAAWINYGPQPPGPWDMFAELPFPRSEAACIEAKARDARDEVIKCVENARIQNWRDGEQIAWTIMPPIILLLIGLLAGWVLSGFRPNEQV